jgi:GT2 family glycosyltransferase
MLEPLHLLRGLNALASVPTADGGVWKQVKAGAPRSEWTWNPNPAWVADGKAPWLFALDDTEDQYTVRWFEPGVGHDIPVSPGVFYEVAGEFGLLGGTAELRIAVLDADGVKIDEKSAEAGSKSHRGGSSRGDYQRVSARLVMPPRAVAVRVELDVVRRRKAGAHGTRAMLIALPPTLTPWPNWTDTWSPLPGATSAIAAVAAGQGMKLYEAPVELGVTTGQYVADVHDLELDRSVSDLDFGRFAKVTARVEGYTGNSIEIVVGGTAAGLSLYVDGIRSGLTATGEAANAEQRRTPRVEVAQRWCDGNPHVIEVRDETGLVVLDRTDMVLPAALIPWAALQQHGGSRLPYQLSPLAVDRYRSLREQISSFNAGGTDAGQIAQLHVAHAALETGFERNTRFAPLRMPKVEKPTVTVVVPVHNKFSVTYHCLAGLLLAANDVSFEVVVVDDGSSDETLKLGGIVENVRIVRNEQALGFVGACNAGVAAARGEYVVLLNNDTEVTAGWLDELVEAFGRFDNVGMVGSRLLYPDGRLQEAGGIVWNTGNPWNYGRGANPADPRFGYARQVDFLSGAAIMLPRAVWDEVGALSQEFAPAYFEDTDLAFKVRDAGYTTWYVPSSRVYHFEGLSNGTDVTTTTGLKRFQEINRPKFQAKWASAVRHNGADGDQPDLAKDRGILGRVLFIDAEIPRPDQDAGSFATMQAMRLVQSLGYKVTFIPANVAYLGDYSEELGRMGIEAIHAPFALSVAAFLEARGAEFDVVYITRYGVAQQVLAPVRNFAPQAKVLFCNSDLHFLRHMRTAEISNDDADWARTIEIRDAELEVMRKVDVVLSYNEVEHGLIRSHNMNETPILTCPWVVEEVNSSEIPAFTGRKGIAFLGGYAHPPNAEAVEFFVANVIPVLRNKLPDVQFNIYGSNLPDSLKALADDVINPVGFVATVDEVYFSNRLFVAPLLTGAGIKGKVLGAMAHGIPTVLSSIAAEGTGVRAGVEAIIADSVDEWVEAIVALYDHEAEWNRMSQASVAFTTKNYSFEHGRKLMTAAFHKVGIYRLVP